MSFLKHPVLCLLALLLCSSTAFQPHPHGIQQRNMKQPATLFAKEPLSDEERKEAIRRSDRIGGTGLQGKAILAMGCLLSAWIFTIPPSFRRHNFCTEADTIKYPEVCTTTSKFAADIKEYYANGGGIKWDFTVADSTRANLDRWSQ